MPKEPDDIKKRLDAAAKASKELTKGMQVLSDTLDAQRKRTEATWNAATAEMRRAYEADRNVKRPATPKKHKPKRRRR